jgi:hypothetical protein
MGIEFFSSIVAMLVILSVASERLVEIIKGFVPFLDIEQTDRKKESMRKALLHILAILAGIATALLAMEALATYVPNNLNKTYGVVALGLLASGGSGLWNSILGYANEVKKLKKKDREKNT